MQVPRVSAPITCAGQDLAASSARRCTVRCQAPSGRPLETGCGRSGPANKCQRWPKAGAEASDRLRTAPPRNLTFRQLRLFRTQLAEVPGSEWVLPSGTMGHSRPREDIRASLWRATKQSGVLALLVNAALSSAERLNQPSTSLKRFVPGLLNPIPTIGSQRCAFET
jgi:hypothetical protein